MSANAVNHTLFPARIIHMPAFVVAFILAPLLITLATFWLFVPVYALVMGGPLYLVLGFPLLLWHLSRKPCIPSDIAGLALVANAVATALGAVALLIAGQQPSALIFLYIGFGSVFAPLWGYTFALLYNAFTRNA